MIIRGGTTAVGIKNAAPQHRGVELEPEDPLVKREQEVSHAPHVEQPDDQGGPGARLETATMAAKASTAATRSPYAAGRAKADGSEGETTPGTKKLSPMNRKVWGNTNRTIASSRSSIRSQGQR